MKHKAIFMYKLLNNFFCCSIPVSFNGDFHDYYTGQEMTFATPVPQDARVTGRQLILDPYLSSNVWNRLDTRDTIFI